jgi:uncharacterized OsmC-like protein
MTAAALKDLFERKRRVMSRRPWFGRFSAQARVRIAADLCCDVEEAAWRTRIDQTPDEGGTGTAPYPGQMMRASLVACLAMGYRMWGARLDVAIDQVEIEMVCESDVRGQLGFEDVTVGWKRIVMDVRITSAAPEADVRQVVATADRFSPMLANLSPAIERVHHLRVIDARAGVKAGRGG